MLRVLSDVGLLVAGALQACRLWHCEKWVSVVSWYQAWTEWAWSASYSWCD